METRGAPHPESAFAPQRAVEETGTAAGVVGWLVGADPLDGFGSNRGIDRYGIGAGSFGEVVENGIDAFVDDVVSVDGDTEKLPGKSSVSGHG